MAADFKKVKPRKGLIVRFPRSYAILPEAGGTVPWIGPEGRYWRRRASTGDVVFIQEQEVFVGLDSGKDTDYSGVTKVRKEKEAK